MDDYDVIIVGTGAGGGTLARHLAPSGKRILLLERGDWLPREPQNWLAQDVFVDNRYVSADTWYDEHGQAVPAADPLLRRRRDQALRRGALPAARRGLRRAAPPRRRLAGLADLLRRARAVLHAGRAALRGARRARRGPDRAAGERALPVPGGLARAAHPAALRRPRGGRLPPVPRAVRDPAGRGEHAVQRLRPLRELRRLPVRSCTPSPTPRCSACGRRSSTPNVTLLTNAHAVRLETNAAGARVDRGRRRARRRRGALPRRRRRARLRRGQHGQAAAALGERRAPERPRQRLRPGRPQLHVPQQPGRARAVARGEPDRLPEDARRSTTSTSAATSSTTRSGNIQMVGKSQAPMFRGEKPGETKLAPHWTLERDRAPRDRLLALDRGPAAARNRVTRRPRRQRSRSPTRRPTTCRSKRLYEQAASRCSASCDMHDGPPHPPLRVHEERDPGGRRARTRRARAASAPTRRRPC